MFHYYHPGFEWLSYENVEIELHMHHCYKMFAEAGLQKGP